MGSVDFYYACHTYNQWYVLNTDTISVPISTGTIMINQTGMALCFRREVQKVAVTIPAQCTATLYSGTQNAVNNANIDVYGYLASSDVGIVASTGVPNSYIFSDDNTQGNSQWKLTYSNTTNSSVTIYLYNKQTSAANVHRFSTIYYYGQPLSDAPLTWSLGTTYTLSSFSTSATTRSVAVTAAANKTCRITATVPAHSIVTFHSESTSGNPIGFLNPTTAVDIDGTTGNPTAYSHMNDNTSSLTNPSDWQFVYDNSSGTSNVTVYIYHRATATNTQISSTIYGVCRYIATSWSIGNTYTMPSLSSTGYSTAQISVACLSGKVARITLTMPAYSTMTLYSSTVDSVDVIGYATNSAIAINSSTGAPNNQTNIVAQDDDSGPTLRQWKFKLINNSSSAVTRYIYHRCYNISQECNSTIYVESTAGNGWTYAYKGQGGSFSWTNSNSTQTATFDLTTAANEVGVVYYPIPQYSTLTVYPTTTSNIDTLGFLYVNTDSPTYQTVYSYGGAPVNYTMVDDDSHGNGQWQLSYTNTSPTHSIYLFIYTRAKAVNTATTQTLNATLTTTVPNWTLGNTYAFTLPTQATGTAVQYADITIRPNTVTRIALSIAPTTSISFTTTLFSQDYSDRPYIIGYVANSTSSIDPETGKPATVNLTVNYNGPGRSAHFTYHNNNSSQTVTFYVYLRNYFHGRTDSGGFVIEYWPHATIPNQLSSSHVKVYNGTSWVDAVPKLYNGTSWVDLGDTIYDGSSWI